MSLKKIENCTDILATVKTLKISADFLTVYEDLLIWLNENSPFPPRVEEFNYPPESIKIVWEKGSYRVDLHLVENSLSSFCDLERWHKFGSGYVLYPLKNHPRKGKATKDDILSCLKVSFWSE